MLLQQTQDNIMNWISWVLPVLIALPLIGGVLAGILTSDRVRYTLVTLLAVLIAAGGIGQRLHPAPLFLYARQLFTRFENGIVCTAIIRNTNVQ